MLLPALEMHDVTTGGDVGADAVPTVDQHGPSVRQELVGGAGLIVLPSQHRRALDEGGQDDGRFFARLSMILLANDARVAVQSSDTCYIQKMEFDRVGEH